MIPEGFEQCRILTGRDVAMITAAMYLGGLQDSERRIGACAAVCGADREADVRVLDLLTEVLRIERVKYEESVVVAYGAPFLDEMRAYLTRARFVANIERSFSEPGVG